MGVASNRSRSSARWRRRFELLDRLVQAAPDGTTGEIRKPALAIFFAGIKKGVKKMNPIAEEAAIVLDERGD